MKRLVGRRMCPNAGWDVLLKQARKGDVLIITELSRLGRNLMEVMSFLHQCMEKEVLVLTVKEHYELGNNINSKILAFAFRSER